MQNVYQIKTAIIQSGIKVVSFDIFDTLLERPAMIPTDIFILLQKRAAEIVNRKGFDFYKIRCKIESEARLTLARKNHSYGEITYNQIYAYFASKYGLSDEQRKLLASEEIVLESEMLRARSIGQDLYAAAVAAGKRIICVSDMYHSGETLARWLVEKGYTRISHIYVSSEIKKRKDTGSLYSYVLDSEKIQPHELMHVGDNIVSDVELPIKMGIISYHLPSSLGSFRNSQSEYSSLWAQTDRYSPSERLAIGFFINRWAEMLSDTLSFFPTKYHLGYFGLGLPLLGIAQFLRLNVAIQTRYPTLHFASRDGYLPQKAYNLLCGNDTRYIKSHYLYCGRSLYSVAYFDGNCEDYIIKRLKNEPFNSVFNIGHLFHSMVCSGFIPEEDHRRNILIKDYLKNSLLNIKKIINERRNEIAEILKLKRVKVRAYYNSSIQSFDDGHALIFDCGYSGSVSEMLMKLTGKQIDKAYIWEKPYANLLKDKHHRTQTYLISGSLADAPFAAFELAFEELFSPLEPGCVGIELTNTGYQPVFDTAEIFSDDMMQDINTMQDAALDFVKEAKTTFGSYLDKLSISKINLFLQPLAFCLRSKTDMGVWHLENIVFNDNFYGDNRTLAEKMETNMKDSFSRTDFVNKKKIVSTPPMAFSPTKLKLAIHIHLYHLDQAALFIDRLGSIKQPFDLLLSVCSEKGEQMVAIYFNKTAIPAMNNMIIKITPNRGRDVAPWIVGFGKEQDHYDLVCHLHTKKSPSLEFGIAWRDYLLDNLVTYEAINDIIQHFECDSKLGLVFPPPFKGLINLWMTPDLAPLEEKERSNCLVLLSKMGIKHPITRHNVFFSPGTMFWYRPKALSPLFAMGLDYSSFPEEPIGVSGSLAHAIERLPALVAESQGYKTLCYIRQSELVQEFVLNKIKSMELGKGNFLKLRYWCIRLFHKFFHPGTRSHQLVKKSLLKVASKLPLVQLRNP